MAKLTGTNPGQVPTNADLGDMAYKDGENFTAGPLTVKGTTVGIGTTDPGQQGYALDIRSGDIFVKRDGVEQGNIYIAGSHSYIYSDASNLVFVNNNTEGMRVTSGGDVTVANELIAGSYNETYSALSGTSPTVNCETGNVFSLATTGNTTFTFTNPPASGTAYGFTLKVTAGGTHTLTWPASVDWAGGTAPDAPASGETNVLVFITHDGGTTWYGFQAGAALA